MRGGSAPCRRRAQPVAERMDALRVVCTSTPDGRTLVDYALVFGRIREEIVRETVSEGSMSSEGVAVIKPVSPVVVLRARSKGRRRAWTIPKARGRGFMKLVKLYEVPKAENLTDTIIYRRNHREALRGVESDR
jgi:hypothetical protein